MKIDQLPTDRLEQASNAVNTMMEIMGKTRMSAPLTDVLSEHGVKRCSVCLEVKHLGCFFRDSHNRDGLEHKCKACSSATSEELKQHKERKQEHLKRVEASKDSEAPSYKPLAPQERLPKEVLPQAEATVTRVMNEFYNGRATPRFNDVLRAHKVKRCASCQQLKYPEDFPGNKSTYDGLHDQCRGCNSIQRDRWYSENAEEIRARYQEWYKDNSESERERMARNYYNPDGRYRLSIQLHSGYHRAVRVGNPAERVTPDELIQYWSENGINPLECWYTKEPLTEHTRSVDHKTSIAKGGGHVLDNLVPATLEANTKKKTKSPEEFLATITEEESK